MFQQIGAAIASERTRQGLRPNELGVAAEVVEALETGKPGVTTTQLEAIAHALQVDEVALRAGEIKPRPVPSVFLRHRSVHQDFAAKDLPVLDAALEHARSRNVLASLVGDPPGIFPRRQVEARGVASDVANAAARQGYQLARELRRLLGNEADALGDLRELAENACGVTVLVRQLSTIGSSALAIKAGDAAAIVLVPVGSAREPFARVWIAHELGHILYDLEDAGVHVVVDFDGERHAQLAEQRARAFAAELLLPEAGLRKLIGPPAGATGESAARKLVALARDAYGATWQVTANHLANLGFVAIELRDWLERQPPLPLSRSWTTSLAAVGAPSPHVAALTRRAYDAEQITDGEVRALLGLDVVMPLPWEA
jgi:Zn-dependent peptidase ImmA (M78 family)